MILGLGSCGGPRQRELLDTQHRAEHRSMWGTHSSCTSSPPRAGVILLGGKGFPRDNPSSLPSGHFFGRLPLQMLGSGPFGPQSWLLSPGWVAVPARRWQRRDVLCSPQILTACDLGAVHQGTPQPLLSQGAACTPPGMSPLVTMGQERWEV